MLSVTNYFKNEGFVYKKARCLFDQDLDPEVLDYLTSKEVDRWLSTGYAKIGLPPNPDGRQITEFNGQYCFAGEYKNVANFLCRQAI